MVVPSPVTVALCARVSSPEGAPRASVADSATMAVVSRCFMLVYFGKLVDFLKYRCLVGAVPYADHVDPCFGNLITEPCCMAGVEEASCQVGYRDGP